jgi:hypothetical protein
LQRFDEAGAGQREKGRASKTCPVQTQRRAERDEEEDVQDQIDGRSLATLQTPERNLRDTLRRSEGENGDCNQTGKQ